MVCALCVLCWGMFHCSPPHSEKGQFTRARVCVCVRMCIVMLCLILAFVYTLCVYLWQPLPRKCNQNIYDNVGLPFVCVKIGFVQVGVVCAAWWHLRELSQQSNNWCIRTALCTMTKLGWRQVWHAVQKLLLSSHPWPNINVQCTIWKKNKYSIIHW